MSTCSSCLAGWDKCQVKNASTLRYCGYPPTSALSIQAGELCCCSLSTLCPTSLAGCKCVPSTIVPSANAIERCKNECATTLAPSTPAPTPLPTTPSYHSTFSWKIMGWAIGLIILGYILYRCRRKRKEMIAAAQQPPPQRPAYVPPAEPYVVANIPPPRPPPGLQAPAATPIAAYVEARIPSPREPPVYMAQAVAIDPNAQNAYVPWGPQQLAYDHTQVEFGDNVGFGESRMGPSTPVRRKEEGFV